VPGCTPRARQQQVANLRPRRALAAAAGAVVVIGLGEEGRLRTSDLIVAMRQGTLAYAQRVAEQRGGGEVGFELAATLVGSGAWHRRGHLGAGRCARRGRANQRLRATAAGGQPPQPGGIVFDCATEAHNALAVPNRGPPTSRWPGHSARHRALRRPADSGYRGVAYDFITAVQRIDEQ
jgi:hypothetical protein